MSPQLSSLLGFCRKKGDSFQTLQQLTAFCLSEYLFTPSSIECTTLITLQLLGRFQTEYNAIKSHLKCTEVSQQETVRRKLISFLESLRGITLAADSRNIDMIFKFLSPYLSDVPYLLENYANCPDVVELILCLFVDVIKSEIMYLKKVSYFLLLFSFAVFCYLLCCYVSFCLHLSSLPSFAFNCHLLPSFAVCCPFLSSCAFFCLPLPSFFFFCLLGPSFLSSCAFFCLFCFFCLFDFFSPFFPVVVHRCKCSCPLWSLSYFV